MSRKQSPKEPPKDKTEFNDRYGPLPTAVQHLMQIIELKQVARKLGFSRIKPDGTQHVVLETPMEEPAWNLLKANLPDHLQTRFVYTPSKVTVRGLGALKPDQQLAHLIEWLGKMEGALPTATG